MSKDVCQMTNDKTVNKVVPPPSVGVARSHTVVASHIHHTVEFSTATTLERRGSRARLSLGGVQRTRIQAHRPHGSWAAPLGGLAGPEREGANGQRNAKTLLISYMHGDHHHASPCI